MTAGPLEPYVVEESGRGLEACLADVNRGNYDGYGPDYRLAGGRDKVVVDTLARYEHLISGLAAVKHLEFVPHCEMIERGCPPDRILCSIRHDVDSDIRAAVSEAEIEQKYGARTSYYVLHTSVYYGRFDGKVFRRQGCMAILYRRLQELGHEVALHTDPLWLYQTHGIDGAAAVVTEIEWLREQGLTIVGTVAHNSASVYGIENSAVFKGRNRHGLALDRASEGGALLDEIVHDGKWAPLGTLDEAEMGLTYEGNDLFRQGHPHEYGATRSLNRWRWNPHVRQLRANPDPNEGQFIDQDRMLEEIHRMQPGQWLILNVHPLYYGSRHSPTSAPLRHADSVTVVSNERYGWETYAADTIQMQSSESQSINCSNAEGMLDAPAPAKAEHHVLMLGGRNLDGRSTGVREHCNVQVSDRLDIHARKLAFPGMGLCRHFGWFRRDAYPLAPKVVIIGVGADELNTSLPEGWMRSTGFALHHPPGEYLRFEHDRVRVVERCPGAAIRRGRAHGDPLHPNLTEPGAAAKCKQQLAALGACLAFYADEVRQADAVPIVLLQECGESVGLWSADVGPTLRQQGHTRCLEAWRPLLDAAGVELIDPYASFLGSPPQLPTHWSEVPEWNYTGHRLAAVAIMDRLRSILPQPAKTPAVARPASPTPQSDAGSTPR
jgi:hypothetical protein